MSAFAIVVAASYGCAGPRDVGVGVGNDGLVAVGEPGEPDHSLVRIDVQYDRSLNVPNEAHLDAQAYFVRYHGLEDRQVPTLLGFPPAVALGPDRCLVLDDKIALDRALATRKVSADLALLDAGRVELRAGLEPLPLWTRHYPELVPGVTGTVYGAAGNVASGVVLGAVHTLASDGGSEVGPFSVTATAPAAFPEGHVERTAQGLRVRWTPSGNGMLDVEVRSMAQRSSRAVHCRVADSLGTYDIPSAVLGPLAGSPASIRVILRNRTQTPFEIVGLGAAELNLELRETLRVGAND